MITITTFVFHMFSQDSWLFKNVARPSYSKATQMLVQAHTKNSQRCDMLADMDVYYYPFAGDESDSYSASILASYTFIKS